MFGVTGGYHRYFSHRTYRTSRAFQFVLAVLAQTSVQKGALWWAAHHRDHHKYSDTPKDPHSCRDDGFWWSHVGWILSRETEETDYKKIRDLARYPELRWLNNVARRAGRRARRRALSRRRLARARLGLLRLDDAALARHVHDQLALAHGGARRRYTTTDDSKNNPVLALVTMGEGWHNNHHYYPRSVRQGFFWWEIDLTYYVLRALAAVGLVWDLHVPSQKVLAGDLEVIKGKKPAASSLRVAAPKVRAPAIVALALADADCRRRASLTLSTRRAIDERERDERAQREAERVAAAVADRSSSGRESGPLNVELRPADDVSANVAARPIVPSSATPAIAKRPPRASSVGAARRGTTDDEQRARDEHPARERRRRRVASTACVVEDADRGERDARADGDRPRCDRRARSAPSASANARPTQPRTSGAAKPA